MDPFWKKRRDQRRRLFGEDRTPRVTKIDPNTGLVTGGLAVTITGDYFHGSPSVLIGAGAATSVVVVDRHTITAVTPIVSSSGVVDVSVTIDGATGTLSGGFTFVAPTIITLTPNFGPLTGGTDVVIFGYNFDPDITYRVLFDGVEGSDPLTLDSQHILVTTPNHALGFVTVRIEGPPVLFDSAIFDPAIFDETVYTPQLFTSLSNAFQYTLLTRSSDIRRQPGISISDVLNNSPNSCDFTVDGKSNAPTIGEKIEIRDSFDGDRLLFAGMVQTVEQVYEGQIDQLAWHTKCVDFTWLFNRRRPFGVYRNMSVTDVIKDLVTIYAPGFTTDHVQTNLAKVSISLDGNDDFASVMSKLAQAIGGGHWFIDYNQDVHFFHIAPPVPPFSGMPTLTQHITLAEGASIPSTMSFPHGYYFVRHAFLYDDGTEGEFGGISNFVLCSGTNQLTLSTIPLGPTVGPRICVARRIYFNQFLPHDNITPNPIEDIQRYAQINDNSTTTFTSWFGSTGANVATVGDIPSTSIIPSKTFNGHPAGPLTPIVPEALITSGVEGLWSGEWTQFKVACVYRDGSVSFPSPASISVGLQYLVNGSAVRGFNFRQIPIGDEINGNDVVARFIYFSRAPLVDPNFVLNPPGPAVPTPIGAVWPVPFEGTNEPILRTTQGQGPGSVGFPG